MTTLFIILCVLLAMLSLGLYLSLRTLQSNSSRLEGELAEQSSQREQRDATIASQMVEISTLQVQLSHSQSRISDDKEREKQMSAQFKNLANDILSEQSRQFKETNKESIDILLKPFRDNITDFRKRVEDIHSAENKERGALKQELDQLMELNRKITSETNNLTNALRGNSKVQGDWGEMILDTILQSSSLVKGMHYTTQSNFKDEEGHNLRPDVVLNLPEGKQIIIDSKTSLTAFVNYSNSESVDDRKRYMDAHILSVRQHIKELTAKSYQDLVNSPDFVIMFIPSEPAFLAALQSDNSLWSEAYDKRVIISSPTNLFALLKLVDDLWKRDKQDKNTAEIVAQGTKLYEQMVNFTASLEGVGVALDTARVKYDDAYKRLCTGNGNIIRSGEKLRKLGLPTKKRQSAKALIDNDMDED